MVIPICEERNKKLEKVWFPSEKEIEELEASWKGKFEKEFGRKNVLFQKYIFYIFNKQLKSIRPDFIILKDKEVLIKDFKLKEISEAKQLVHKRNYKKLLKKMYPNKKIIVEEIK